MTNRLFIGAVFCYTNFLVTEKPHHREFNPADPSLIIFEGLKDGNRVKIFLALINSPKPLSALDISRLLSETITIDYKNFARHLRILKSIGLVTSKRSGKETLYSVSGEEVAAYLESFATFVRSTLAKRKIVKTGGPPPRGVKG